MPFYRILPLRRGIGVVSRQSETLFDGLHIKQPVPAEFTISPGLDVSVSEAQTKRASRLAYRIPKQIDIIPPYPYGENRIYKQSNRGLYGGLAKRFGNKVSERNEIKTRRTWKPNIRYKKLYSESLGRQLRLRVAMRVLRTIEKCGGLDEYLLGNSVGRIKELGPFGWRLRWRVMQTPMVQERFRKERKRLGLPEEGTLASREVIFDATTGKVLDDPRVLAELRAFAEKRGSLTAQVINEFDKELDAEDRAAAKAQDEEGVEEEMTAEEEAENLADEAIEINEQEAEEILKAEQAEALAEEVVSTADSLSDGAPTEQEAEQILKDEQAETLAEEHNKSAMNALADSLSEGAPAEREVEQALRNERAGTLAGERNGLNVDSLADSLSSGAPTHQEAEKILKDEQAERLAEEGNLSAEEVAKEELTRVIEQEEARRAVLKSRRPSGKS